MTRVAILIAAAVSATVLTAATPVSAQIRLTFDKRPSIKVSGLFTVDIRVKSQTDFRGFPVEPGTDDKEVFDLHRARVGIEGTIVKRFEYQLERELHDTTQPWRDAYVDARIVRHLDLRAGQFKIPFGLDQLTGSMDLDFNYRSLAGTYLAPGRDVGLMADGRVVADRIHYQVGIFRRGGDNVRASERSDPQTLRTLAARLVFKPWDGSKSHHMLRTLAAGIAVTSGEIPEGLNSVRGKTVPDDPFFDRVYVNGRRQRIGTEFQWRPGSLGIQGEFIHARDERRGQGIEDEDLPDVVARGWYVSSTWLVTGERKKDHVESARPFLAGGIGSFELAARVEQIGTSGSARSTAVLSSPRTPWVPPRADTVWTTGINWYVNSYVKLQANLIRERRALNGRVLPEQEHLWSRTLRLQFGM
jgi:phosphate-selective porin OprO and OprP